MVRRNKENTGKDNMLRGNEDVHRKVEYEKLDEGISLVSNTLAPGSTCQLGNLNRGHGQKGNPNRGHGQKAS